MASVICIAPLLPIGYLTIYYKLRQRLFIYAMFKL